MAESWRWCAGLATGIGLLVSIAPAGATAQETVAAAPGATETGSAAASAAETSEPGGRFDALELRSIGPAGGRVSRAAGVPGDPRVYWAATAQGGVWRSEDGGAVWKSVFDDQPVASIGS